MQYRNLGYETKELVAYLTLNRPERKNAIGGTMREDILDAFARAEADADVRAVILTGAGPPIAIRLARRCLRQSANASLRETLDRETAAQNLCFDTEDAREGMLAFVEKRAPVFRGL